MRIFPRAAGAAALFLFVFACSNGTSNSTTMGATASSSSTGSGVDAGASIIDTFCTTVAAAFCEADYTCCTNTLEQFDKGLGIDVCKEDIATGRYYPKLCAPSYDRPLLEAALQAGTTVFDQAQFDRCVTLLKSMAAGGAACVEPPKRVLLTTCLSAFRGQSDPGASCPWPQGWDWIDRGVLPCKDGSCNDSKCVPFLKIGDPCVLPSIDPVPQTDSRCNYVTQEACWGVTVQEGAGGSGGAPVTGTCRPQGEVGDACDPGNYYECKSLNCDATTGKCALPDPHWAACQD